MYFLQPYAPAGICIHIVVIFMDIGTPLYYIAQVYMFITIIVRQEETIYSIINRFLHEITSFAFEMAISTAAY